MFTFLNNFLLNTYSIIKIYLRACCERIFARCVCVSVWYNLLNSLYNISVLHILYLYSFIISAFFNTVLFYSTYYFKLYNFCINNCNFILLLNILRSKTFNILSTLQYFHSIIVQCNFILRFVKAVLLSCRVVFELCRFL